MQINEKRRHSLVQPYGCGSGIQSNRQRRSSCIVFLAAVQEYHGRTSVERGARQHHGLRPQTGSYKATPDVPEHWLIAEEVAAVDPALIGLNDGKPHVVKTQNVVGSISSPWSNVKLRCSNGSSSGSMRWNDSFRQGNSSQAARK